ncbi:hypothetical protein VNO77_22256 [Canavalia gladiata]|uniref:Uncharacterized protein n=1 Tax=Canavalia gladiata TaxID=3824 RepID=A0AAN9QAV5_CANGL
MIKLLHQIRVGTCLWDNCEVSDENSCERSISPHDHICYLMMISTNLHQYYDIQCKNESQINKGIQVGPK